MLRIWGEKYGNIKIHHLIRKSAHLIIETKHIIPRFLGREDKIALPFFGAFEDCFARRTTYDVVDVEGAAALHL